MQTKAKQRWVRVGKGGYCTVLACLLHPTQHTQKLSLSLSLKKLFLIVLSPKATTRHYHIGFFCLLLFCFCASYAIVCVFCSLFSVPANRVEIILWISSYYLIYSFYSIHHELHCSILFIQFHSSPAPSKHEFLFMTWSHFHYTTTPSTFWLSLFKSIW